MSNTATTTHEVQLAGAFFKGATHLSRNGKTVSDCNGRWTESAWTGAATEVTCKRCQKLVAG